MVIYNSYYSPSPIIHFCYKYIDCLKILLDRGADINSIDHGNTILIRIISDSSMFVVQQTLAKYKEIVYFLLERGIDKHFKNNSNRPAYDIEYGNSELKKIIRDYEPIDIKEPCEE